jgi:hypothetical protein
VGGLLANHRVARHDAVATADFINKLFGIAA